MCERRINSTRGAEQSTLVALLDRVTPAARPSFTLGSAQSIRGAPTGLTRLGAAGRPAGRQRAGAATPSTSGTPSNISASSASILNSRPRRRRIATTPSASPSRTVGGLSTKRLHALELACGRPSWNLHSDVVAYGQLSSAKDPVDANIFLVNANRDFDLTDASQWEIRLKADLAGGRTQLTAAWFRHRAGRRAGAVRPRQRDDHRRHRLARVGVGRGGQPVGRGARRRQPGLHRRGLPAVGQLRAVRREHPAERADGAHQPLGEATGTPAACR